MRCGCCGQTCFVDDASFKTHIMNAHLNNTERSEILGSVQREDIREELEELLSSLEHTEKKRQLRQQITILLLIDWGYEDMLGSKFRWALSRGSLLEDTSTGVID